MLYYKYNSFYDDKTDHYLFDIKGQWMQNIV